MVNHLRHLSLGIIVLINIQCSKDPGTDGPGTGTLVGGNINKPPVAIAGLDHIITLPDNFVLLDGSGSSDPNNNISSYSWSKISGPVSYGISNPTSAQTQVTILMEGTYKFELKVTDVAGLLAKDTVEVTVKPRIIVNQPPVANAGPDQLIRLPLNASLLNGSASFDPDGTPLSYIWTKISGPSSYSLANLNSAQTMVTGLTDGVYWFSLKVTDANGSYSVDMVTVIVDTNDPGIFNFYNVPWTYQDCSLSVNNIYYTIPSGRPFKVYIADTDWWGGWSLIQTFSGSNGFYYQVINDNLKISTVGFDCAFASYTYAVRIVMD